MSTDTTRSAKAADVALGARIKKYRTMAGLSQSALATALGITFQQIQKYEKGSNRVAASRLMTIAQTLGCSLMDLTDGSDDGPKYAMDSEILRLARQVNALPTTLRSKTVKALFATTDAIQSAVA